MKHGCWIFLMGCLWWAPFALGQTSFSDSSLLRISKSVYFKSSLKEWRALSEVASSCVERSYGDLVLFEIAPKANLLAAFDLLAQDQIDVQALAQNQNIEDFLFILRLDLYRESRPTDFKLELSANCTARVLKDVNLSLSKAKIQELETKLGQFEALLRDRVGMDVKAKFKAPLRRRQLELVSSLRETLKSQYSYEWLVKR